MAKEGFLKEERVKERETACQFGTLNTVYALAMIAENCIQETRTSSSPCCALAESGYLSGKT